MFIRIKPSSASGKKKVQLCETVRTGNVVRQHIVRHIGVASNESELEELKKLASVIAKQIQEEKDGPFLFNLDQGAPEGQLPKTTTVTAAPKDALVEATIACNFTALPIGSEKPSLVDLNQLTEQARFVEGFHDTYGNLFNSLGLHQILPVKSSQVLKEVVLARIAHPTSKHAAQEMLAVDFGVEIPLDRIYRMMDRLQGSATLFQKRIFQATDSLCFKRANLVFFDVTTLYFESTESDELRQFGYSKDQQFQTTQVVVALATTEDGLPIGYKSFPGNTAEVKTLLLALEEWRSEFLIDNVCVVADRAMMSEGNLLELEAAGIKYIIGAKLKALPKNIQKTLLEKQGEEMKLLGELHLKQEHRLGNRRLVVTYNEKRASKDKRDREKTLEKARQKIGSGRRFKSLMSNRGSNKYLKAEVTGNVSIDEEKIAQDGLWDGLHGIITNDDESHAVELLGQYRRLWVIEESFRLHKHHLSIRPVYHFKPERIEAHLLICYLAFSLIRYAEHRLKLKGENLSIEEVRRTLWRCQSSILKDHQTEICYRVPSKSYPKVQAIYQSFGVIRNQRIDPINSKL
jgi:Transposase DDE domain